MKQVQYVWRDIKQGENIDLYITMVSGVILAVLNIIGITSQSWIMSLTLTVLALLAYGMLGNRHQMQELTQTAEKVFQEKWPDDNLNKDIREAKELLMIGISLRRTIKNNYVLLEDKLREGHSIRVLLVKLESPACEIAANRTYYNVDINRTQDGIREALEYLYHLKRTTSGNLTIRTVNYPPSVGGFIIDPTTSHGTLYLEHYTYKMRDADRPKIILRRRDGYWYDFFAEQAQVLWENGQDWSYANVE